MTQGQPVAGWNPSRRRRPGRLGGKRCSNLEGQVANPQKVVGGAPQPLHPAADPQRRQREGARGGALPGWLPPGGDPGWQGAGQRRGGLFPRRQPPRARPGNRAHRDGRVDDPRYRADEAVQHQRRAHLPLPGRPALVRPVRRLRPVPDRRSQYRIARAVGALHQRPGVVRRLYRPRQPHGRARQEPPLGDHLVAGQRIGVRAQPRRAGGVDPPARPDPPAVL